MVSVAYEFQAPWLCVYWPVMKLAREGQHSGLLTTAFLSSVPCLPTTRLVNGIVFPLKAAFV